MADHVHLLFVLSKNVALAKAIEEVKKESSKWAKGKVHPRFYWQTGYGAFSVSASMEDTVSAYIENQEKHHRKTTFQEELVEFFRKHRIPSTRSTSGIEGSCRTPSGCKIISPASWGVAPG